MRLQMLALKDLKSAGVERYRIDDSLSALKSSIWNKGILIPILAAKNGAVYDIIDGKRRYLACRELNFSANFKIPTLIVEADAAKKHHSRLLANTVRQNYGALEQAEICNILINENNERPQEVADTLGVSKAYINRLIKIFSLPKEIVESTRRYEITFSHALYLTKLLTEPDNLDFCFRRLLEDKLSIRDLRTLISSLKAGKEEAGDYNFFPPRVTTTTGGSRLRFEPRRRSLRVELNIKTDEPLEAIISALKDNIDNLMDDKHKAVS